MKRLLVLIDLQNDFISGSLGAEGASEAVENAKKLIASERAAGARIVYTRDRHDESYPSTQEGRLLPVAHCVAGTWGFEIANGLYEEGALIFDKGAFASKALASFVEKEGFEEVVLAGICTDICVVANAMLIKATCPEVTVRVASSACAGTTKQNHEAALAVMKSCQIFID